MFFFFLTDCTNFVANQENIVEKWWEKIAFWELILNASQLSFSKKRLGEKTNNQWTHLWMKFSAFLSCCFLFSRHVASSDWTFSDPFNSLENLRYTFSICYVTVEWFSFRVIWVQSKFIPQLFIYCFWVVRYLFIKLF